MIYTNERQRARIGAPKATANYYSSLEQNGTSLLAVSHWCLGQLWLVLILAVQMR
jgi:hypothetical protein